MYLIPNVPPAEGECFLCGGHIPELYHMLWCDSCLDEFITRKEGTMDDFIEMKKAQRRES